MPGKSGFLVVETYEDHDFKDGVNLGINPKDPYFPMLLTTDKVSYVSDSVMSRTGGTIGANPQGGVRHYLLLS